MLLLAAANGGFFSYIWPFAALAFLSTGLLLAAMFDIPPLPRAALWFACAIAALTAWTALTAVWSASPGTSLHETGRALMYVCALVAFVAGRKGLVIGTIGGATIVAGWALVGRITVAQPIDPTEGKLLIGPIGYANALGALAAMGVTGALITAVQSSGRMRGGSAACLIALVPALALTNSRGAWLACAVGLGVGLLVACRRRTAAVAMFATAAVALGMLLSVHTSLLGDRDAYWSVARETAGAHLVTGSGAGTFASVYAARAPHGPPAQDAHSLYLETLDELGLVGLALLLACLALPLALGLLRMKTSAAAIGIYVVFVLHTGLDWDWEMPVVVVAGLAAATHLLTCGSQREPGEHASEPT